MNRILIATVKPFAKIAVEQIRQIFEREGFELSMLEKYENHSDLIDAVSEADALIVRSDNVDEKVINSGKNLKIIVRAGAGYDNINLEVASDKNIVVMNTPGQNANAVAELALGMMVYTARNLFNGTPGTELKGKRLGIHALGNVGKHVARIAKGFGMEVFAYDPYIDRSVFDDEGVSYLSEVSGLFATCQYVSVHIPANEETIKSINYDLMSRMPQGAVLVNTARKELICEDSLLKIMTERQDFRYVTDITPDCNKVFEEKFKGRYFFTPKKMGAQTAEANINAGVAAAHQIVNFIKKGDTTFRVN